MASVGDRLWAPHPQQCFAPCIFREVRGNDCVLVDTDDNEVLLPKDKLADLPKVFDSQLDGVDDVTKLEEVSIGALLHTVQARYTREQPHVYTRVSRIMIAVNPFQALHIYSADTMRKYLECRESLDLPPHIFAIGADAVHGLQAEGAHNQAVLISGESGAGKTESTKLILSYISEALGAEGGGGTGGSIQDKIMNTNPILESFGNAMTARNNNSSRFGKWLQIDIGSTGLIQGVNVIDYLLEGTRITKQGADERGFHVFFQVCQAQSVFPDLGILDCSKYRYTKGCQAKAPGIDDAEFFRDLLDALTTLSVSEQEQKDLVKIVVGILSLGNIDFQGSDAASVVSEEWPAKAASLLGLDKSQLINALVKRGMLVGKEFVLRDLTSEQAQGARDSMSRLLYGRLFKMLIHRINKELGDPNGRKAKQFFGVLDIAGFESFETNTLEQLWINVSNEHLQSHFNDSVFKMELADYKAEGIDVLANLTYPDNSDIIAMLDAKGSILGMLDEEGTVPKATDLTFASKVCKAFEKHKRFQKPKFAGPTFTVEHFAGRVIYNVDGWLEKNIDRPPPEATKLFQNSSNTMVKEIGTMLAQQLEEAAGGGGKSKKVKTVSSTFRASVASLVGKLHEALPHFIRCIKPNTSKLPGRFNPGLVNDQLNCSGVFEAVRIRQSGFASRVPFKDFISRYRCLLDKEVQADVWQAGIKDDDPKWAANARNMLKALPDALVAAGFSMNEKDATMGKTKVFNRSNLVVNLDRAKDLVLIKFAITIQRITRGYMVRKVMKVCQKIFDSLAAWRKDNSFYLQPGPEHTAFFKLQSADAVEEQLQRLSEGLEKAAELPLVTPKLDEMRKTQNRMEQEALEVRRLKLVVTSIDAIELDKALLRVKDLELPTLAEVATITERYEKLKTQMPLVKAMNAACDSRDLDEVNDVWELVVQSGMHLTPGEWIAELKASELVENLQKLKAELEEEKRKEEERLAEEKRKREAEEAERKRKLEEEERLAREARERAEEAARKAEEEAAAKKKKAQEEVAAAKAEAAKASANEELLRKAQEKAEEAERQVAELDRQAQERAAQAQALKEEEEKKHREQEEEAAKEAQKLKEKEEAAAKKEEAVAAKKKEKRDARKSKRVTVTGLSEEDQRRILLQLGNACDTFDIEAMEQGLSQAIDEGIEEGDILSNARKVFKRLNEKEFVLRHLDLRTKELSQHPKDKKGMKVVQNLLKQADRLHIGNEPAVDAAKKQMVVAVRARSRNTVKGKLFEDIEVEDLELADGAFSNLFEFNGLKKPNEWGGHKVKSGWFFNSRVGGKEVMLKHSKLELQAALTNVGQTHETKAVNVFNDIQGWMGDRAIPEVQRMTLAEQITATATQDKSLADEVYVQLMKQLTENPGSRSVRRGWELMLACCQHACPSSTLHEFLHTFLLLALKNVDGILQATVRQCIADLNITASPEKLKEDNRVSLTIMLIDHSTRKVRVPSSAKLRQLGEILAEQLRISEPSDFSLFQITEGLSQHRLLPDNGVIANLQAKWQKLKEMTKRESRLLYKRRLLRVDEVLHHSDRKHAELTYKQALYDYLHYPVPEDPGVMTRVGAAVLWCERDGLKEIINKERLFDEGILEQLLPMSYLRDKNRKQVAKQVMEHFSTLRCTLDARDNPIWSMGRALSKMQKLKLFGAFCWQGRQVMELPADKASVEEAPKRMCIVHPSQQKGEMDYFICVDYFGVRFVAASGKNEVRGFLFNREALERVLVWGAKQDILQLVVSSVDPSQPAKGRIPMSIVIKSTAAVDVAYVIHMIYMSKSESTY